MRVFALLAGMTNKIFAGFSCRQLGTDASVMNANYGSSCESDEYILVLVVCSLLTIVWAIGIPATLFWEMYKVRELITEGDPDTLQKFEFVLGDYDREHWYWEWHVLHTVHVGWSAIRRTVVIPLLR